MYRVKQLLGASLTFSNYDVQVGGDLRYDRITPQPVWNRYANKEK